MKKESAKSKKPNKAQHLTANPTPLGRDKIRTLYAILNRDYRPADGALVDTDAGNAMSHVIMRELFQGSMESGDIRVLRAFVESFEGARM